MCETFNVNRGWRGRGNVPIQISITLSSSLLRLVANDIMEDRDEKQRKRLVPDVGDGGACGASTSAHTHTRAPSLQFWISFPHQEMTEVLAWYAISPGRCPRRFLSLPRDVVYACYRI